MDIYIARALEGGLRPGQVLRLIAWKREYRRQPAGLTRAETRRAAFARYLVGTGRLGVGDMEVG